MHQSGFSLLELMIVVAIISILAAIAIPSYKTYTQRARFAEVISGSEPYKIAVALAIQQGVPLTAINTGEHGIPKSPDTTRNLASIKVSHSIITATELAGHYTYQLTPDANGSVWNITGTCIAAGLCEQ